MMVPNPQRNKERTTSLAMLDAEQPWHTTILLTISSDKKDIPWRNKIVDYVTHLSNMLNDHLNYILNRHVPGLRDVGAPQEQNGMDGFQQRLVGYLLFASANARALPFHVCRNFYLYVHHWCGRCRTRTEADPHLLWLYMNILIGALRQHLFFFRRFWF
jgi:hypothetical protein